MDLKMVFCIVICALAAKDIEIFAQQLGHRFVRNGQEWGNEIGRVFHCI